MAIVIANCWVKTKKYFLKAPELFYTVLMMNTTPPSLEWWAGEKKILYEYILFSGIINLGLLKLRISDISTDYGLG